MLGVIFCLNFNIKKKFMDELFNFFMFRFDFLCFYATFYRVRFLRFIRFFFRFD